MAVKFGLTVSGGNYTIVSYETGSAHIGSLGNVACKIEGDSFRITDRAWRNWMPILIAESDEIAVTDSDYSYDDDVLTTAQLSEYLQAVIVPPSGGGSGSVAWGSITGNVSSQTDLSELLQDKQDKLTAGTNITIDPTTNTISAIGGGGGSSTQPDWNQTDSSASDYIKNKPTVPTLPLNQYDVDGLVAKSQTIQYVSGKYFSLSKSVGESISINSPASNSSGYCLVLPITDEFQKVILHSYNASASTRPWAITNSSGVILSIYDWGSQTAAAHVEEIKKEDLPNGAAYIVCDSWEKNSYTDGHYAELYTSVATDAKKHVDAINPLRGKKVVVFGDSIAEGVDNRINSVYTSFADYLKEYGCEVTKLAVGGTHLTPSSLSTSNSFNGYSVYHLVNAWVTQTYTVMDATTEYIANNTDYGDRWAHVPSTIKGTRPTAYDVAIILAGTNDWNNAGRVLGQWSDTSPVYNYTAAMKSIVNGLRSVNPNMVVVFVTPPVRWVNYNASDPDTTGFSDYAANANSGLWLTDVAKHMAEVAAKCKAIAINAYDGLGVNEVNFSTFFTTGGVHPNEAGQKRIARIIAENMNTRLLGGTPTDHHHTNKEVLDAITASAWAGKVGSTTLTGLEAMEDSAYGNLSNVSATTLYITY